MNAWSLTAAVCLTLALLAGLAIACARSLDEFLHAPQRALLTGVAYLAGFVTAVALFALRS